MIVLGLLLGGVVAGVALESSVGLTAQVMLAGTGVAEMSVRPFLASLAVMGLAAGLLVAFGASRISRAKLRRIGYTHDGLSAENAGLEAKNRLLREQVRDLEADVNDLVAWHERILAEIDKLGVDPPERHVSRRRQREYEKVVVLPDLEAAGETNGEAPAEEAEPAVDEAEPRPTEA